MPKRLDIKKILIIGSGPIVIGQACEFDYSGSQACKVLRQEGYKVVLINSNPATIMTDPDMADETYIEPITVEMVAKIIKLDPSKIDPNANIFVEYGVDSLLGVEILAGLDKKYGLDIPEQRIREIRTLNDVIRIAKELIEKKA